MACRIFGRFMPVVYNREVEAFDDTKATEIELELDDDIKTVPAGIENLKRIQRFAITSSTIKTVPDSLFLLPKLRELKLQLYSLRKLPAALGKAKALRVLDLESSGLRELPSTIASTKITSLVLAFSDLKKIPPALWNVKTLKHLELPPDKTLAKLPPGISKLTKLESLVISGKALRSIAKELPAMKKLKSLEVMIGDGVSKEVELPEELARMKLTTLKVSNFTETVLPDVITRIATLEHLDVWGLKIKTLIDELPKLPKLKTVKHAPWSISKDEARRIKARYK